jgi:hypothetical protein
MVLSLLAEQLSARYFSAALNTASLSKNLATSILALSVLTHAKMQIPIQPMPKRNQYAMLVLPPARVMIAEEISGPAKPEVLPTQLSRAKNMYILGCGTTSESKMT